MDHIKRAMYPTRAKDRLENCYDRVLFIDPGFEGTGWALFDSVVTVRRTVRRNAKGKIGYVESGVYRTKGRQWVGKTVDICAWFKGKVLSTGAEVVVIELPEVWSGSDVSMTAAASGALIKLAYLVGGLAQVSQDCGCRLPVLVLPREWKGQLPKDVVIARILQRMPKMKKIRDHEADAIGMALAAQGLL